ncbi:MAG: hypothetical protein V1914_00880 [archaeon]
MTGINIQPTADIRELLYQILKSDPALIARLQKIAQEAQALKVTL